MDKQNNNTNKNSNTKAYASKKSQSVVLNEKNTTFVQNRVSRIAGLYEKTNTEYQSLLKRKNQLEYKLKKQSGLTFKIKTAVKSFFGLKNESLKNNLKNIREEIEDINQLLAKKEAALDSISELTVKNSMKLKDCDSENLISSKPFKSKKEKMEPKTTEAPEPGI